MHPHWTDLPRGTTTARDVLSHGRQFQIPTTVTTTWRGPLQLGKRSTLTPSLQLGLRKQQERRRIHVDTHTPRPLTRFRVMMRPIDIVEQELEMGVSGADLTNEIHHHLTRVKRNDSSSFFKPTTTTGTTTEWPLLSHTHHHPTVIRSHVETYTHRDSLGPLNIAITFTRSQSKPVHLPSITPQAHHNPSPLTHSVVSGKLRLSHSRWAPSGLTASLAHKHQPLTAATILSGRSYAHTSIQ